MNTLIVAKQSKYEWEMEKFNISGPELLNKYTSERANFSAILESYDHQVKVREMVARIIPGATMCMMNDAPKYLTNDKIIEHDWDMIIVLGGDNSFTFVAGHAAEIPVLGVNSDPHRSVGYLTGWSIYGEQDVYDMVEMIDFHEYDIDHWTRLHATMNGKMIIPPASNEYFLGERQSNMMSRHVLVYKGKEYEQKSSGILCCTGAGSTGWYSSVRGKQAAFDPKLDIWSFVVREPYDPSNNGCYDGVLGDSEELVIHSLNDSEGIISVDSWSEHPFTRGSEARIFIGCPLSVVIPNPVMKEE